MSSITLEAQYDPASGSVTLVATKGFGGDRYAVTVPAATAEEAEAKAADWRAIYREAL